RLPAAWSPLRSPSGTPAVARARAWCDPSGRLRPGYRPPPRLCPQAWRMLRGVAGRTRQGWRLDGERAASCGSHHARHREFRLQAYNAAGSGVLCWPQMTRQETTMADQAQDKPDRIDLEDQAKRETWERKLNVTQKQLREAVQAVGDNASDVEMDLTGSRTTTNDDKIEKATGSGERPA